MTISPEILLAASIVMWREELVAKVQTATGSAALEGEPKGSRLRLEQAAWWKLRRRAGQGYPRIKRGVYSDRPGTD